MWGGGAFFVKAKITKHGKKKNDEDEIGINILKHILQSITWLKKKYT